MFINSYIFVYRGDVVIPSSSIVNNYLEREIALKLLKNNI